MNSSAKNVSIAVLTVAVIFLGTVAWRQWGQIAAFEQAAANASTERNTLQKRLAETEQRAAAAEKARLSADTKVADARNRTSGAAARAADTGTTFTNTANLLDTPAMQKVMAATFKGTLDQRYGGLFRMLKLSPAELDKFKDLLAERQMSAMDVMRALQTQGGSGANPKDLPALMSKVQGEVDESIRTLIGDQRFQQYQDFNQNIGSYTLLDQIERRLSYTNAPLQESQSSALLRVLADSSQSQPPAGFGAVNSFVQGMAGGNPLISAMTQRPISDDTIARAQGVLSPTQIDVLRQIQAEQQSQTNMLQSFRTNAASNPTGAAMFAIPLDTSPVPPPPRTLVP